MRVCVPSLPLSLEEKEEEREGLRRKRGFMFVRVNILKIYLPPKHPWDCGSHGNIFADLLEIKLEDLGTAL